MIQWQKIMRKSMLINANHRTQQELHKPMATSSATTEVSRPSKNFHSLIAPVP